jgi:integrase
MPRQATGSIVDHRGKDGKIYRSLRFRAHGKRYTEPLGVVSLAAAGTALRHLLADVERGTWTPPAPVQPPAEPEQIPTFHAYSEQWWELSEAEWSPNTREDYRWRLESHLLPYFGTTPVDQITGTMVKRYIAEKAAEGERIREAAAKGKPLMQGYADKRGWQLQRPLRPLSARSTNMTLTTLAAILDAAIDDDAAWAAKMPRNAARGRRVKERAPTRTYLDSAEQIAALLDAAGELDRGAAKDRRHVQRRAMIATLVFAGLRIGELCALRWRDVDLAAGWLTVGESKTDAGRRRVKIRPALRAELLSAMSPAALTASGTFVFPTRSGAAMGADNFRNRVLAAAVKRASKARTEAGQPPLPRLTPHSLRRTFSSVLYAIAEPPPIVMQEMGHTDPALALRVYAQAMRRDEHQNAQLRALVEGRDWANMGERDAEAATGAADAAPQSADLQA